MVIVRKLEYLVALANERHFARAASTCHVSQPTLSAGIQQLETELGVQIVKRGRRFQGFTDAGEMVLAWARKTTFDAVRLQERLAERQGSFTGTLRIGVLGSAIPLMKTFTVPFQRRYPNVNLRVMIHNAFDIQQAIEDCSIDVGVTYLDKKSRHYGCSHALYSEEYELLIRRGTRFSGEATVPWEAIRELPLCLLIPDTRIFGAEESEILNDALTKTPHIVTSAIWMVMDHVRSGKWASVLPRPVRIMIADDDVLEAIPLPRTGDPPSVGIVLPRMEPRSPQAEAFFEIATSNESLKTLKDSLRGPRAVDQKRRISRRLK
jgi:DNA-binding transcriptional LysR family regulator